MKILWFTWKDIKHPLAGGAEVVNDELAKRLVNDGHEVTMIVGGFKNATVEIAINGYQVVRLGNRYSLYVLAARYYLQNLQGWADIIIEEVNTMPFFTRFYAKEPVVLFFHQLCREVWFYQLTLPFSVIGYLIEPVYLRFLGRATPVVTVSQSAAQDLGRCSFNNVTVIPLAVRVKPVTSLDIKKYPRPTILSFGALRSMKRTLHQIKAFELAKMQIPQLQLIVAGGSEGSYGQKVKKYIVRSRYAADIQIIDRPGDNQKIDLLRRSHAVLMTGIKEGWGLVVTEAASQGTPAVVYNADGLRDSVKNGETGIITARNPASLAAGIVTLLEQPATYRQLQKAAWQWSKQLTFDATYAQFLPVLWLAPRPAAKQLERAEP